MSTMRYHKSRGDVPERVPASRIRRQADIETGMGWVAKANGATRGDKKNFGFTLVEILIAMAAATLVLIALYGVYIVNSRSYRRTIDQQELAQNARISLERMSRDIRQAERIVTELPPDDTDPMNPPPSQIQFQDGHETSKIQYIVYYLTDTNLKRQVKHYYFSSSPSTWVAWNAQDEFGNLPNEAVDEDAIKADKIQLVKFYGVKVITMELQVANTESTFDFKTDAWGRNIQ